eukprot:1972971-Pleurochrysis_carterae.AAC.1
MIVRVRVCERQRAEGTRGGLGQKRLVIVEQRGARSAPSSWPIPLSQSPLRCKRRAPCVKRGGRHRTTAASTGARVR